MRPTDDAEMVRLGIPTRAGEFLAVYSARGLAQLHFPTEPTANRHPASSRAKPIVDVWHRAATAAVKAILAGCAPKTFPPLDLTAGTAFQQSVWRALEQIPPGQTRSYGEIARAIGKPQGVRAVGRACGANPIPVLVPCHRVLAAKGRLGGFSGGLEWKRKLLECEGASFYGPPRRSAASLKHQQETNCGLGCGTSPQRNHRWEIPSQQIRTA